MKCTEELLRVRLVAKLIVSHGNLICSEQFLEYLYFWTRKWDKTHWGILSNISLYVFLLSYKSPEGGLISDCIFTLPLGSITDIPKRLAESLSLTFSSNKCVIFSYFAQFFENGTLMKIHSKIKPPVPFIYDIE